MRGVRLARLVHTHLLELDLGAVPVSKECDKVSVLAECDHLGGRGGVGGGRVG